jgi:hypothetical protein
MGQLDGKSNPVEKIDSLITAVFNRQLYKILLLIKMCCVAKMKIETFGNNQTESPQDGVSNSGIKAFSNCRDVQGKARATSLPEVRVFLLSA